MAGKERKVRRSPPYLSLSEYPRRLPHKHAFGGELFVTWTLASVVPICKSAIGTNSQGKIFAATYKIVDQTQTGPLWLKEPRIAEIVRDVHLFGKDCGDHTLDTRVIMPNHVYMIVEPVRPLWAVMREIKSNSARMANRILNSQGEHF